MKKIGAVLVLIVLFACGCSNEDIDVWESGSRTREEQIMNLSSDWVGVTYRNDFFGFETSVPNSWIKTDLSKLKIHDKFNRAHYDKLFTLSGTTVEAYDAIKIMEASSQSKYTLPDSVELFVIPTFASDVQAYISESRNQMIEKYADKDWVTVSEQTTTKLGKKNTVSFGLETKFNDEIYYQLIFAYYTNGYFVVFSIAYNEDSENEANKILESTKVY